jgi:hypothetical protein
MLENSEYRTAVFGIGQSCPHLVPNNAVINLLEKVGNYSIITTPGFILSHVFQVAFLIMPATNIPYKLRERYD